MLQIGNLSVSDNRLLIIEQPVVKIEKIPIRTRAGSIIEQIDLLAMLVAV